MYCFKFTFTSIISVSIVGDKVSDSDGSISSPRYIESLTNNLPPLNLLVKPGSSGCLFVSLNVLCSSTFVPYVSNLPPPKSVLPRPS